MFGLRASILPVVLKRRAKLTGRSRNCPPSSKTKSSTVCFTFAGGGRNLLSSNLNRPLLGRQHSRGVNLSLSLDSRLWQNPSGCRPRETCSWVWSGRACEISRDLQCTERTTRRPP
nr:unnamed protein product [Callosobruchus chinensis]